MHRLMLQQDESEHFVDAAAKEIGIAISWKGKDMDEKGYDANGNCIIQVAPVMSALKRSRHYWVMPAKAKRN